MADLAKQIRAKDFRNAVKAIGEMSRLDPATRADPRSIAVLEGFRPMAGEPRRTEFEKLDPWNLPWPTSVLAEKKGIPPGTPFVRIWSLGTGLLDLKNLEEALARIRARA